MHNCIYYFSDKILFDFWHKFWLSYFLCNETNWFKGFFYFYKIIVIFYASFIIINNFHLDYISRTSIIIILIDTLFYICFCFLWTFIKFI